MEYNRLLRNSHIFASTVREVLERCFLEQASPLPLTISQFYLLKLMSNNELYQVGEIAELLGVSNAAASKNIDKLEGLDLVSRTQSEGDRRATLLALRPKGKRLVQAYENLKSERLSPVFEQFDPGEVDELSRLLEKFSAEVLRFEGPAGEELENSYCLRCAVYLERDCPVGDILGGCPYNTLYGAHHQDEAITEGTG